MDPRPEDLDFLSLRDATIEQVRIFREFAEEITRLSECLQQKCPHEVIFEVSSCWNLILPRRICCGCLVEEDYDPLNGWGILKHPEHLKQISYQDYIEYRGNHPLKNPNSLTV